MEKSYEFWNDVAKIDKKKLPKCKALNCRNHLMIGNQWTCKKCSLIFCSTHRLYENHNCLVYEQEINDFKKEGKLFKCDINQLIKVKN